MSIKTVFVIGAGASKEANLPTGNDLKGNISKLLDIRFQHDSQISGDHLITSALRERVTKIGQLGSGDFVDINPYLEEAWHIRDALPLAISIDNFIDNNRGNEELAICGKLAIVRSILEAEKNSYLYFDEFGSDRSSLQYNALEKTWYNHFFKLLTENCAKDDLEERFKSIALIIFNYDRCLEHFLYHALQYFYRISKDEAVGLVRHISIHHPYGSVGSLPWYGNSGVMGYGSTPNAHQLLELSSKIKTFTEGTDPGSSNISDIREYVYNTDKLVFIGFAFHKLNMKLLSKFTLNDKRSSENVPKCYATTFDISESDMEVIGEQIRALYKVRNAFNLRRDFLRDEDAIKIKMANLPCNEFFLEFWKSLAF